MTALHLLWLPVLLSAVFVFVASSVLHMVTPWHKGDYLRLPDEDRGLETLRTLALPPGDYMIPRPATREDVRSAAFKEKLMRGPVIVATVIRPGRVGMGRQLGLWFLYCVAVSVFAAYIAARALPVGAPYRAVFRFAGATAFIGYSAALWQFWIWYQRSFATTLKSTIDGLIYACLTAGTFGWLWPR